MSTQQRRPTRPAFTAVSTRASSPSWSDSDSDLDDLITPCPYQAVESDNLVTEAATAVATSASTQTKAKRAPMPVSPPPESSAHLSRRCSTDASVDVHGLWEAMLHLQQQYHCYNSTRMMIAADSDQADDMMPSRACLDLLNDSIEDLPAEGWAMLERYLADDQTSRRQ